MFHADKIDGAIELKNFMADMENRPDAGLAGYIREHFDDFIDLCKKAGLEKNLAFYCFSESQKSKKRIEFDEYWYVCRVITLGEDGSSVTSEAWEASMFLLLLASICRNRRISYMPWSDTVDFMDPDEHNWTSLMKIIGAC